MDEVVDSFWSLGAGGIQDGAELNFIVCRLIDGYLESHDGIAYASVEAIKGALKGAVDEFHDRIVRPYEDLKRAENGEVFHFAAAALARLTDPDL